MSTVLPERSSEKTIFRTNTSYCMSLDQVASFFNTKIKKVIQTTGLPRSAAVQLLCQFKWNTQRLTKQFTECGSNSTNLLKAAGLFSAILAINDEKLKSTGFSCVACQGLVPRMSAKILPKCRHALCSECWVSILLDRLTFKKGNSSPTFKCPAGKSQGTGDPALTGPAPPCENEVPDDFLKNLFEDEKACRDFIRKSVDEFVKADPFLKWCPSQKGCTNAILVEQVGEVSVRCQCGYAFCFSCLKTPHDPIPCNLLDAWLMKYARKPCPKCKFNTPQPSNQFYRAVTCKNKRCNHQFCWDCLAPWRTHNLVEKNCPSYRNRARSPVRSRSSTARSNIEKVEDPREERRRFEHCYNGYKANSEALQNEKDAFSNIENRELAEVAKELAHYRQAIMYSYVLAYYFQADKNTGVYLAHLASLENATNGLSLLLKENVSIKDVPLTTLELIAENTKFVDARMRRLLEHANSIPKSQVDWYMKRQKSLAPFKI